MINSTRQWFTLSGRNPRRILVGGANNSKRATEHSLVFHHRHHYYSNQTTDDQKRQQEQAEQRRKEKQKEHRENSRRKEEQDLPVGISPWARFMDVLKSEYAKSQEMQENVRELTGTAQGLKDSEAAQKMRQAYTALRLETLIKENPRLASMASSLTNTGRSVSEAVNHAAKEIEESRLIQAAKRVTAELDKRIGEPIRKTEAYKVVEDTVDFSQGALRYGGYIEKEERRRRRQKRLERLGKFNYGLGVPGEPDSSQAVDLTSKTEDEINDTSTSNNDPPSDSTKTHDPNLDLNPPGQPMQTQSSESTGTIQKSKHRILENPNAPPALVLHSTANQEENKDEERKSRLSSLAPESMKRVWEDFKTNYEDSDHPIISSMRTMTNFVGRFFDETETAKVVRMIKEIDPDFEFDGFLRDLREYIVPEIVDAYVDCDLKSLRLWTSEGAFNVITAPVQTYLKRGLVCESQVIDLKGIDIMSAKILEEREIPVFVISFKTHEITYFRDPKQKEKDNNNNNNNDKGLGQFNEIGDKDTINQVVYVIVMTREFENCGNSITGGWKVIDLARRSSVAFL